MSDFQEEAKRLDEQDLLAHYRDRFVITDPDLIYMDGNSLGRLPKATVSVIRAVLEQQWGDRLIRSWNEGWFTLNQRIGAKIAGIIGAQPDEVIVADATSVNLFKLAVAALQARPKRHTIVTDDLNFPSDLYIFQGIAGENVTVVPSEDKIHGNVPALIQALNKDTALLSLSHTAFKSGYTYNVSQLTQAAHQVGALTLWDLSHSVGVVPIYLNEWHVDLAVGCTYKYVNGGPGAPAFLYVRHDLQEQLGNPISGWFGQKNMFHLDPTYEPTAGIVRFLTGTPTLLSLAAIEPGIDLLLDAGINTLRAKSVAQTEYFIRYWQAHLQPLGFLLGSPKDVQGRGSHVSLAHDEAWRINRALIEQMNVIPDFRRPSSIRFGIAPLYTSFMDVYLALSRLQKIVDDHLFEQYDARMPNVT